MKNHKNKHQEIDSRIKCPYCSEKIQPEAKKCRFCDEWLIQDQKSFPTNQRVLNHKHFFYIWFISLLVFYTVVAIAKFDFSKAPTYLAVILGLDILVGGVSFLVLIVELLRDLFNKNTRISSLKYGTATIIFFIIFFLVLYKVPSQSTQVQALGPDQVIEAVNQKRESNGKSKLTTNPKLAAAAKTIADDMCQKNYFSLPSPEGRDALSFIESAGYMPSTSGVVWSEGFYNQAELADSLYTNENTKITLSSDEFTETGVGISRCGLEVLKKTTDVIVQVFAKPAPTKPSKSSTQNTSPNTTKVANANASDLPVHCQVDSKCGGGTTPLKKSECDRAKCCLVNGTYKFTKDPNECQDTMVKCNIHPNCGGGYKEMRKADCDNMICCQLKPDKWELRAKGQCNQEQSTNLYKECSDMCFSVWNLDKCNIWTDINQILSCQSEYLKARSDCLNTCN